MFDYALLANDSRLKLFVRDAYDWARQNGIPRLGIFPQEHGWTEGCNIADMVGLAVALTDAGMGDYWDDVEQYARNGLVEAAGHRPGRNGPRLRGGQGPAQGFALGQRRRHAIPATTTAACSRARREPIAPSSAASARSPCSIGPAI